MTLAFDWMSIGGFTGDAWMGSPVASAPNGPFAAGSTPVYQGSVVDEFDQPVPLANLAALTLSIVDTLSGQVINGCSGVNILNHDRGTVDVNGNVTVQLEAGDTTLAVSDPSVNRIQRSMVFSFTYSSGSRTGLVGRHQVNFIIDALAA